MLFIIYKHMYLNSSYRKKTSHLDMSTKKINDIKKKSFTIYHKPQDLTFKLKKYR